MSWMDSWSRPSKHAATPPPLYLTAGSTARYCHTCGRIIGPRKTHSAQEVKYCSTRCRNNKPGSLDRQIENVFALMLDGVVPPSSLLQQDNNNNNVDENENENQKSRHAFPKPRTNKPKKVKGDPRIIVECSDVEAIVFGHQNDPDKVFGRKKNRAARGVRERPEDWRSVDMVDDGALVEPADVDDNELGLASDTSTIEHDEDHGGVPLESAEGYGGGKVRPPQEKSDVNGSVGGEKGWAERIEETDEMKLKRRDGQRKAEEREMVRKAARRGCAFGFVVPTEHDEKKPKDAVSLTAEHRQKCEAVMKGTTVEASYAKGEWGIRWREKI